MRRVLCMALVAYNAILFVRIIMSWLRPPVSGPLRTLWELIFDLTEPVLGLVRGLFPLVQAGGTGLDFSPILVFVILGVLQSAICF